MKISSIDNKTNFASSTSIIKVVSKKGDNSLKTLVDGDVTAAVLKKLNTKLNTYKVPETKKVQSSDEWVMEQMMKADDLSLQTGSLTSPGARFMGGTLVEFRDKSKFKDIRYHFFTLFHDQGERSLNTTTIKKFLGFYSIKNIWDGSNNLLTRSKEKFVESLSDLIAGQLK